MTREDFEQLARVAQRLPSFERTGVFSPLPTGERKLFPTARPLPRWRWDLNRPGRRRFDLLVASNVFMYSPDPARWFRNVFASCRYFLMLDLVRRRRGEASEFAADGDRMRYAVGDARPRVDSFFSLQDLGDRLLAYRTFYGGANAYDDAPLHVLALFRGDLAGPVLRIDDYPTGIRPLLPDLAPLHDVLGQVESRELPYHLGIVPALLDDEMVAFLNGLEHMKPVVHGYDHAYPTYAPLLREKGDPYNQHTVGVFNEFKGQSFDTILAKLRTGRHLLQNKLARPVATYIPPCNLGDRTTGKALMEAGYHAYFSEKRIPGCRLPWFRSGFYGRSNDYDYRRTPDVVTLHVTWEWDVLRAGETQALGRLLDHLAERRRAEQERGRKLADMVGENTA